jgi:hypothetical protein
MTPGWLYRDQELLLYQWHWVALGAVLSAGLLLILSRIGKGEPAEVGDVASADLSAELR